MKHSGNQTYVPLIVVQDVGEASLNVTVRDAESFEMIQGSNITLYNDSGAFNLSTMLSAGQYSLSVFKDGYIPIEKEIWLEGSIEMLVFLSRQDSALIRFVLSWDNKDFDLDLFAEFVTADNIECSVGFYNPLCEGVSA